MHPALSVTKLIKLPRKMYRKTAQAYSPTTHNLGWMSSNVRNRERELSTLRLQQLGNLAFGATASALHPLPYDYNDGT